MRLIIFENSCLLDFMFIDYTKLQVHLQDIWNSNICHTEDVLYIDSSTKLG